MTHKYMDFQPTNIPEENEYPKLVRDNIPQIIKNNSGKDAETVFASTDDEYLKYLLQKMIEEANELKHSLVEGNMQEELADVLELIDAILELKGWSMNEIQVIKNEKRKKNGGFGKRIVMLHKTK